MKQTAVSANPATVHRLWQNFLLHPPVGYRYLLSERSRVRHHKRSFVIKKSVPLLDLTYKTLSEYRIGRRLTGLEPDLIYMLNGQLARGTSVPWIVDFENPYAFCNFQQKSLWWYRRFLIDRLNDASCKAILAYSHVGALGFREVFPEVEASKVKVVPNCVPIPEDIEGDSDGFTMLFTGSVNIEDNFEARGGPIAVEVFKLIKQRFPQSRLVLRCRIPDSYSHIHGIDGVTVIEDRLDRSEFEDLFRSADVYLFPAFVGYALSTLEAMSWGLPVVTTNVLENGEYVVDGVTGYTVENSLIKYRHPGVPEYLYEEPAVYPFAWNEPFIEALADRVAKLLEDGPLRKRMGQAARKHVIENYSLEQKNRLLKQVFDEII